MLKAGTGVSEVRDFGIFPGQGWRLVGYYYGTRLRRQRSEWGRINDLFSKAGSRVQGSSGCQGGQESY